MMQWIMGLLPFHFWRITDHLPNLQVMLFVRVLAFLHFNDIKRPLCFLAYILTLRLHLQTPWICSEHLDSVISVCRLTCYLVVKHLSLQIGSFSLLVFWHLDFYTFYDNFRKIRISTSILMTKIFRKLTNKLQKNYEVVNVKVNFGKSCVISGICSFLWNIKMDLRKFHILSKTGPWH